MNQKSKKLNNNNIVNIKQILLRDNMKFNNKHYNQKLINSRVYWR